MTRFRLDGAVAIVTGGFGRLGPIWAAALLDAGATVFALELPSAHPTQAFTALRERTADGRLELLRADIRDRASLEAALAECLRRVGPPSVLVNNAGIDQPPEVTASARLEDVSATDFQSVLGVNVVGTFQATQVFGAAMFAAGGSIINIGSMYASVSPDARMYDHLPMDPPFIKPPAYGPSKAAVVNLTRYFATHWAEHGIRVNSLSPGGVLGDQDASFLEKFASRVPLRRLANADDLVGPLVFLASDASSYITGIDLKVDGGFTAW